MEAGGGGWRWAWRAAETCEWRWKNPFGRTRDWCDSCCRHAINARERPTTAPRRRSIVVGGRATGRRRLTVRSVPTALTTVLLTTAALTAQRVPEAETNERANRSGQFYYAIISTAGSAVGHDDSCMSPVGRSTLSRCNRHRHSFPPSSTSNVIRFQFPTRFRKKWTAALAHYSGANEQPNFSCMHDFRDVYSSLFTIHGDRINNLHILSVVLNIVHRLSFVEVLNLVHDALCFWFITFLAASYQAK